MSILTDTIRKQFKEGDFLVEDALTMSQVLTHHNVPHMYRYYVGDKPLNHVFHCNIKLKEATQCNVGMSILQELLKGYSSSE